MRTYRSRVLLILVLLGVLGFVYISMQARYVQESFGVFGCSRISYDKLIQDQHTPSELSYFMKHTWETYTTDEKNDKIKAWDAMTCEEQNESYTMLVDKKNKRAGMDALSSNRLSISNTV